MTERITPNPLRPIGDDPRPDRPNREVATDPVALLREEFERALTLKARLADEKAEVSSARSLVASLEGMSRFAMRMGLITAVQSRELFAEAKERGLYDGWSA